MLPAQCMHGSRSATVPCPACPVAPASVSATKPGYGMPGGASGRHLHLAPPSIAYTLRHDRFGMTFLSAMQVRLAIRVTGTGNKVAKLRLTEEWPRLSATYMHLNLQPGGGLLCWWEGYSIVICSAQVGVRWEGRNSKRGWLCLRLAIALPRGIAVLTV